MTHPVSIVAIILSVVALGAIGYTYTEMPNYDEDIKIILDAINTNQKLISQYPQDVQDARDLAVLLNDNTKETIPSEEFMEEIALSILTNSQQIKSLQTQINTQSQTVQPTQNPDKIVLEDSSDFSLNTLNINMEEQNSFKPNEAVFITGLNSSGEALERFVYPPGDLDKVTPYSSGSVSSSIGEFTTSFPVPRSAESGIWTVQIKIGSQTDSITFVVE